MADPIRNEVRILGGAVRRLREFKGDTLAELATAAKIHFAYLSNIETGKKQPTFEVIARIATALGVDPSDISYSAVIYVVPASAA